MKSTHRQSQLSTAFRRSNWRWASVGAWSMIETTAPRHSFAIRALAVVCMLAASAAGADEPKCFVRNGDLEAFCTSESYDNACWGYRFHKEMCATEGSLKQALQHLEKSFTDTKSVDRLRAAQSAWESYVRLNCEFSVPDYGGRVHGIRYTACVLGHKEKRAKDLRSISICGNGCLINEPFPSPPPCQECPEQEQ